MKNIYLVQANSMLSNSVYLPYAVGSIAAYSFEKDIIKSNYALKEFIFFKRNINDVIEEMEDPFLVGFSCYMWNIEYNLALAKVIKERWQDCIILFGGPQIPDTTEYLKEYNFIDILIHGEGELPFYELLKAWLNDRDLSDISNISFRRGDVLTKTQKQAPPPLDDFPSPYEMGLFDYILKDDRFKDITFDAVIETNRGCPYGCMYCYFSRNGSEFRTFPTERVKKDIHWVAQNCISYCVCADSNFGILSRDEQIADYVIEEKKEYGFPQRFETASAKNKDDLTFRINQKLEKSDLNRGVSLAVQSMSPKTLEIIGRKNMSINNITHNIKKYRDADISTYTDLILGLPGETKETFCSGLFELIEAGQHYSINIYRCEVLPNTKLNADETIKKYSIKTITSQLCQRHSAIVDDLSYNSRSKVIVETDTMSQDDWFSTYKISICVLAFHSMGLLRYFAIYLRKAQNISYYDFYMNLYNWIENESDTIKHILNETCATFGPFFEGKGNLFFADKRFGDIYWDFDEGLFLNSVIQFDEFYNEVSNYLMRYFRNVPLFNDLLAYQKAKIALPNIPEKKLSTIYDWSDYFKHLFDEDYSHPKKETTILKFDKSITQTWVDYAREIIWYGRRSNRIMNKPTKL